ncbi:MAG TPA: ATP-binding protein, partial [Roseiflexaceae bacterium]|nr:ATP-binding protein [Roseiflexaceae bacterium]
MLTRMRRLIAPPVFAGDEEQTQAAQVLNAVLLALLLGCVLYVGVVPLVTSNYLHRLTIVGAVILWLLGMLLLMRRGRLRLASGATVVGLWVALTYAAAIDGGVRSLAFGSYMIVVLGAGLLLGLRPAIGVAIASSATGLVFLYAVRAGVLPTPPVDRGDTVIWVVQSINLVVAAALLGRALRSINRALERARRELAERRQAEAALQESEARYRVISELVSDYAFAYQIAADGAVTLEWVTDAMTRITGYAPQEMSDLTAWQRATHPEDQVIAHRRRQRLHSGQSDVSEYRMFAKDGRTLWLRYYSHPVWDEAQGRVVRVYGAVQDITRLKLLEQQLAQAQKMEAVGQLAGGVAHDFNNILTIILSTCDLIFDELEPNHRLREDVGQIQGAAGRAAELTQQLLAFSRQQILQPHILNLNDVVLAMEKLLRPLIGEHIRLLTRLQPNLDRVNADPGRIEQVVMNLAINARDAMPDGGTLIIETANAALTEEYARAHVEVRAGSYVMLAISDTGSGMDMATRARIFEPFFTTKAQGKGTGLGLATVHGIVSQSGGHIWVYSEPGHGTTFKIDLPQAEEVATPARRAPRPAVLRRGSA